MGELTPERILRLEPDAVVLLDQRRLPDEEVELRCASAAEVAEAIRTLAVRGAPSIGVAAAYGYTLAAERGENLDEAYRVLAESRPTAVNLVWALEQVRDDPSPERARALHEEEVSRCVRMSAHAAELFGPATRALTHCNAGGLATSGYGSAVGALRTAWERGSARERARRRDAAAPPGGAADGLGARDARDPACGDRRFGRGASDGPRRGRLRRHRSRPDRRERGRRQQDRHLRPCRRRRASRDSVLHRGADLDARSRDRRQAQRSRSRSATATR